MSEYALMLEEFCVYIQFVPDCDSVRSSDLVTVGSKNPMLFGPLKSAQSPKVCALRLIPGSGGARNHGRRGCFPFFLL